MSIYAILFTGAGMGCMLGFCMKSYCCPVYVPIDPDSDSDSDFDVTDYVKYLENMLDDSTQVTTESIQLYGIEPDYINITPNSVYNQDVLPSAPIQATVIDTENETF